MNKFFSIITSWVSAENEQHYQFFLMMLIDKNLNPRWVRTKQWQGSDNLNAVGKVSDLRTWV